ncbi:MAG: penicillin-binding protein 2 [Candidatus Binatia bacterium]|nr:MAG: penicillin-binding protein 2 [Candidatus Binatia bacterium]
MAWVTLKQREAPALLRRRVQWLLAATALVFLPVVARLWYLQVLHGEEMRLLAENNRIRLHRVQATRGTVVDRYGRVVIDSRPSFDAVFVPEDAEDVAATVENLATLLGLNSAELRALVGKKGRRPFQETVVKRDLSFEEVAAVETHQWDLPGVSLQITPRRSYPHGPLLAHLTGYVGEVGPDELKQNDTYRMGDMIGKSGLERGWEHYLRGIDGGQQVEVDSLGRRLRVLNEVAEVPGHTVKLTIDLDLQQAAHRALGDRDGSVVVIDPRNGEILAMVSHPSFDPNVFARGIRSAEWRALITDRSRPLMNRAIQGQYPPGSTFKFIVAAAALEEGVINPFTRVFCPGGMAFGNHYFRCWRKGGHGSVNVHEALVQSCDTFFYQVAQRLGVDVIAAYARKFGLGAPTGVALEHEKGGTIPDAGWKLRRFRQPWYAGETLSVAIGQGYVTATPLQMANAVGMLATGRRFRPHFVLQVESPEGEVVAREEPEEVARLDVRATTLKQIRDALRDVVETDRGTGKKARLRGIAVAGKTGTAQVVKLGKDRSRPDRLPRHQRDHAWFVAYAPADDPEVAVAAIVEHADGGGGQVAAPLVRDVLSAYFALAQERQQRNYAQDRSAVDRAL